jgi:hypothetical protein
MRWLYIIALLDNSFGLYFHGLHPWLLKGNHFVVGSNKNCASVATHFCAAKTKPRLNPNKTTRLKLQKRLTAFSAKKPFAKQKN